MSDAPERDIQPMADDEIAKLKAAVTARWDGKPHYIGTSPGCMMRAEEILSLIKAYEDMKDDYLRRHNDACDRFLEIDRLTRELAEAREALDEKEIASGLTSDGNLWRYWAAKAKDLALKNAALERDMKEKP